MTTVYERRKSDNKCTACGKRPPKYGTRCGDCRARMNARANRRVSETKRMGLCVTCERKDAMAGNSRCETCKRRNSEKCKQWREGRVDV